MYIDDILIYSESFEQHLIDLQNVLSRLQKANVKLHHTKCHFFIQICTFLGRTMASGTISPKLKRLNLLQNMSHPTTKT